MKRGKEIKLTEYENYRVNVGTVDTKDNTSIYLTLSGWGSTIKEHGNYIKVLDRIKRDISKTISKITQKTFNSDLIIVDFDMRESGIRVGKKSFMNCNVTLFQNKKLKFIDSQLHLDINLIITTIIDEVLDTNQYFNFKTNK